MSVKPDDHWMAPVHDMNRDAALDFLGAYMLQVMGKSAHRYRERADELEQEAANLRAAASELDERIKERMANGLEETLSRMRAEAIERGDHREPDNVCKICHGRKQMRRAFADHVGPGPCPRCGGSGVEPKGEVTGG